MDPINLVYVLQSLSTGKLFVILCGKNHLKIRVLVPSCECFSGRVSNNILKDSGLYATRDFRPSPKPRNLSESDITVNCNLSR